MIYKKESFIIHLNSWRLIDSWVINALVAARNSFPALIPVRQLISVIMLTALLVFVVSFLLSVYSWFLPCNTAKDHLLWYQLQITYLAKIGPRYGVNVSDDVYIYVLVSRNQAPKWIYIEMKRPLWDLLVSHVISGRHSLSNPIEL